MGSDFSFSFWMFVPSSLPEGITVEVISTQGYIGMSRSGGSYRIHYGDPSGGAAINAITPEVWHHVVQTYASATRTTVHFLDGVRGPSAGGPVDTLSPMTLMRSGRPALIDELFLFDRILTQPEIDLLLTRP